MYCPVGNLSCIGLLIDSKNNRHTHERGEHVSMWKEQRAFDFDEEPKSDRMLAIRENFEERYRYVNTDLLYKERSSIGLIRLEYYSRPQVLHYDCSLLMPTTLKRLCSYMVYISLGHTFNSNQQITDQLPIDKMVLPKSAVRIILKNRGGDNEILT